MAKNKVESAKVSGPAVIGKFEGKCADSNIENANGMYLGPDLWRTIFASEEYKAALDKGYYIGFLGHPEDPGCMDFKNACIVMKECHLEDDGIVHGSFDLVDTPVGRIVKTFIDAGVTFGISVRGAGDVASDGEVNPDSFVFRGFDLVSFPAYQDAVPTFTEIAASSDIEKQVKYKAVCAAINNNLQSVTSSAAIDVMKDQFSPKSHMYMNLESRQNEINASDNINIDSEKLEGVMNLYLSAVKANEELQAKLDDLTSRNTSMMKENMDKQRKLNSIKRIFTGQLVDLHNENKRVENSYKTVVSANKKLKSELASLTDSNLKYQQKVSASNKTIDSQSRKISSLESKLQETVLAAKNSSRRSSDVDAKVQDLESKLVKATKLIEKYQEAYADLYASAIGVRLENISITASTSVDELKTIIRSGTNTANIPMNPNMDELDELDIVDDDDENNLVTL